MIQRENLTRKAVNYASEVYGLITNSELKKLCDIVFERVTNRGALVELGTFQGRTTRLFSALFRKVITVDNFSGYNTYDVFPEFEQVGGADQVRENFFRFLGQDIIDGRVHLLEMDTIKNRWQLVANLRLLLKDFHTADMVFIDACHSYENVLNDIDIARSVLKHGGIIAGHDIDMETVRKAVENKFSHYEQCTTDGMKLWWCAVDW